MGYLGEPNAIPRQRKAGRSRSAVGDGMTEEGEGREGPQAEGHRWLQGPEKARKRVLLQGRGRGPAYPQVVVIYQTHFDLLEL